MDILKWKLKGISGAEAIILQGRQLVGLLRASAWGRSAYGELRGRMLRFDRKGWREIRIMNIEGDSERGQIRLGLFGNYADILLDGRNYTWKKSGWLNGGSVLKEEEEEEEEEEEILTITGDRFLGRSGVLEFEYSDPAVFLVGVYLEVQARKWKSYR